MTEAPLSEPLVITVTVSGAAGSGKTQLLEAITAKLHDEKFSLVVRDDKQPPFSTPYANVHYRLLKSMTSDDHHTVQLKGFLV